MIEEPFLVDNHQGGEIPGVLSRPEGDAISGVVLCHGFLSSSESSTNLALSKSLGGKGIASVRFDFWGHGKNKGEFSQLTLNRCVKELEQILSWFKLKGIRKVGLVGSSYSGTVTMLVAENHPDLRAVALKCPVSDYAAIWREQLGESGIQSWESSGVTSIMNDNGSRARLNYSFYQDLQRFKVYNAAKQVRVPILIVHGEEDYYVPVDQSKRLRDSLLGEKRLELFPEADHGFSRPEDFEKMIGMITDWMVEKLR